MCQRNNDTKKIERRIELEQKIRRYTQKIQEAQTELIQIQGMEKGDLIKKHRKKWFKGNDCFFKPLAVSGDNIKVLNVGIYGENPFMEVEDVDLKSLDFVEIYGTAIPKEVEAVSKCFIDTIQNKPFDLEFKTVN